MLGRMPLTNKVLIYRWFEEVWNKKSAPAIEELLDAQAKIYGLGEAPTQPIIGPAGFRPFWQSFITAFPDIQVAVESTLAEDEKVAARCAVRGTHMGEGLGFAATGKKIHITGSVMGVIQNGKIVEAWNNFDFLRLYTQLGMELKR